jgi:hypothetical protein
MRRLHARFGEVRLSDQVRRLARWQNPVVSSPAAPLESAAALNALGPSLMPHTSRLQGTSMGLSVLGARATTGVVEQLTRAAVLAAVPERDGQQLWPASVRSTGLLLRAGAVGEAVHDLGRFLQERYPARRAIRPMAVSAALTGGLLWWGGRRLAAREAAVERWPLPQTSTLPATLVSSYAVTAAGMGLVRGFVWSRNAPGVRQRRQPAAVRRPRPAGAPLRHRRRHPGPTTTTPSPCSVPN